MSEITQPPHHLTRDYLERSMPESDSLPAWQEVSRELGWALIAGERQTPAENDERN
ncbi:hypothetical protein OX459_25650 [Janthinobacterium sp. SUN026]|nr:hypothetical protein [Janthinobacterium sp. SUN026]